jgi:hypothetical protein
MFFHVFLARLGELHGDQFKSFLFESGNDFSDESSLDTIGLYKMAKEQSM